MKVCLSVCLHAGLQNSKGKKDLDNKTFLGKTHPSSFYVKNEPETEGSSKEIYWLTGLSASAVILSFQIVIWALLARVQWKGAQLV